MVLGIAAITGAGRLVANVTEIESNTDFGRLYLGLGTWGAITLVLGLAEMGTSVSAFGRPVSGRWSTLAAAYGGLTLAFFTLAIYRVGSLAAIALLLIGIFLLSYHSGPRE